MGKDFEEVGLDDVLGEDEALKGAEVVESEDEARGMFNEQDEMLPQKQENKVLAKASETGFDFGSLMNIPGVVVGDIGIEVSRFPVEKARFTTASRALISIVTKQVVAVKTHFAEEIGSFLCFGGKCCERDLAKVRYLFPIVSYDTDKKGKPISNKLSYQVLAVGSDGYEDLMTIAELNGELDSIDLLVTCKDEQYQKVSFAAAGMTRWKRSPALVRETVDFWKKHMKDLILPVARTITPAEYSKKMSEVVEGEPQGAGVDFDSIFD